MSNGVGMSPDDTDATRLTRKLHELELSMVTKMTELSVKLDMALKANERVDGIDSRVQILERGQRPAWKDIGTLITLVVALVMVYLALRARG